MSKIIKKIRAILKKNSKINGIYKTNTLKGGRILI